MPEHEQQSSSTSNGIRSRSGRSSKWGVMMCQINVITLK